MHAAVKSVDLLSQRLWHTHVPQVQIILQVTTLIKALSLRTWHFAFGAVEVVLQELANDVDVVCCLLLARAHRVQHIEGVGRQVATQQQPVVVLHVDGHQNVPQVAQLYSFLIDNSGQFLKVVTAVLAHVLKHREEERVEGKAVLDAPLLFSQVHQRNVRVDALVVQPGPWPQPQK